MISHGHRIKRLMPTSILFTRVQQHKASKQANKTNNNLLSISDITLNARERARAQTQTQTQTDRQRDRQIHTHTHTHTHARAYTH